MLTKLSEETLKMLYNASWSNAIWSEGHEHDQKRVTFAYGDVHFDVPYALFMEILQLKRQYYP